MLNRLLHDTPYLGTVGKPFRGKYSVSRPGLVHHRLIMALGDPQITNALELRGRRSTRRVVRMQDINISYL